MPTHRHWCATFFEKPEVTLVDEYRYMIVGVETAPTTGKTHYQCYIEFQGKTSMKQIKSMFHDPTVHLEPRAGTREQARDYCKKEGNYTEHGIWATGPGFRTDLVEVVGAIVAGETRLSEMMIENPKVYCQYRNGLKDIQAAVDKKNSQATRHVEVEVISGPTGRGKTERAYGPNTFKIEGGELNWFDGYDGEKTLLIDDYDNDVKITRLLNILDRYQLRLPVKGGFTYAAWTKVFITTNLKRSELHRQAKPAHIAALNRRITTWTDLWDGDEEGEGVILDPSPPGSPESTIEKKYSADQAVDLVTRGGDRGDAPRRPRAPPGASASARLPLSSCINLDRTRTNIHDILINSESTGETIHDIVVSSNVVDERVAVLLTDDNIQSDRASGDLSLGSNVIIGHSIGNDHLKASESFEGASSVLSHLSIEDLVRREFDPVDMGLTLRHEDMCSLEDFEISSEEQGGEWSGTDDGII